MKACTLRASLVLPGDNPVDGAGVRPRASYRVAESAEGFSIRSEKQHRRIGVNVESFGERFVLLSEFRGELFPPGKIEEDDHEILARELREEVGVGCFAPTACMAGTSRTR